MHQLIDANDQDTDRDKKQASAEASSKAGSDLGNSQSSTDNVVPKQPTPSSSRPPPPHPILKKPRGPSASGSRPTARFDLPPESGDEAAKEMVSSESATSDMPPPPRPTAERAERKTTSSAGRKFVATTAASRRRPVLPRRQSSQSSDTGTVPGITSRQRVATGASSQSSTSSSSQIDGPYTRSHAEGKRVARSSAGSKSPSAKTPRSDHGNRHAPGQLPSGSGPADLPETAAATDQPSEIGLHPGQPELQMGSCSPRRSSSSQPRPNARGSPPKRPVVTQRIRGFMPYGEESAISPTQTQGSSAPSHLQRSPAPTQPAGNEPRRGSASQSRSATVQPLAFLPPTRPTEVHQQIPASAGSGKPNNCLLPYELKRSYSATNRGPPSIAGFVDDHRSPPMIQEPAGLDAPRRRSSAGGLQPPQAASSIVGTTTTIAQGQFDSELTPTPAIPEPSDLPDHLGFGLKARSPSLLDTRFTPTKPNPTPPVPFGRSKSQLKLVLEREKEKGHGIGPRRPSSSGSKSEDSQDR